MTTASIICIKKDVEVVLEALNAFGEFHIEPTATENTDIGEYDQNIQRVEQRLVDINELNDQLVKEKTSPLSIFRLKQPKAVQVTVDNWHSLLEETDQSVLMFKEEMGDLDTSIADLQKKRKELSHLRDMLSCMHDLNVDTTSSGQFKRIHIEIASLPIKTYETFEAATAELPLEVHRCRLNQEDYWVCLAMPSKHKEEVQKFLHTYHAEIFSIPPDLPQDTQSALREVKSRLKENTEKEKGLSITLHRLGEENRHNLDSWRETAQNVLTLLYAEKQILQSGRLATINGYVPQNRFRELESAVHNRLNEKVIVLPDEQLKTQTTELPSKIMHSRWIKPFEEITRLYGVPKYDEIDPTPFIAITFPILFGLMFGDVGHGLVLLVGGAVVGSLIKGNQGIKNVCWVMATCGVAAIVAGILFGEFFGQPLFKPLWFSPFRDGGVFQFLIFSLVVGIVQIVSGIVIEMANYAVKHNWADALLTSGPKIAFYLGGVYLIAVYQLDFATWLSGPILIPLIPFIVMVVGKPLFLRTTKLKEHQLGTHHAQHAGEHPEQDTLAGRFFEGGDFLTRLLSNTISYSRILALLMAHWALLLVVYTVAGLIAPSGAGPLALVLAGVVIVFGNVFVLALEGLIVFIHTLRLHFYEWFSKFYAGTGTEFKPYKQNFVYTKLTFKDREGLS
ncbi:MAG: hypothetical protein LBI79_03010 [Nitrososphaerota archaeon]|jgi:V/A-type H+-transporting ATPase subunit I|nr:hypothetical protein [Nitrososphaerota archaeon]